MNLYYFFEGIVVFGPLALANLSLWKDEVNYKYCLNLNISPLHKEYIDIVYIFCVIFRNIQTINYYLRHYISSSYSPDNNTQKFFLRHC